MIVEVEIQDVSNATLWVFLEWIMCENDNNRYLTPFWISTWRLLAQNVG